MNDSLQTAENAELRSRQKEWSAAAFGWMVIAVLPERFSAWLYRRLRTRRFTR